MSEATCGDQSRGRPRISPKRVQTAFTPTVDPLWTRFGSSELQAESVDHLGRNWRRADAGRIVLVARRPHPGLAAFDRELAGNRHAVRDVEARAAELGD